MLLALTLLLGACRHGGEVSEATSAAYDLYRQYADRDDLTVAFIGDYKSGDDTYNAVMLQATSTAAWDSLCGEFGITATLAAVTDSAKPVRQVILTAVDQDSMLKDLPMIFGTLLDAEKDSAVLAMLDTVDILSLFEDVDPDNAPDEFLSSILDQNNNLKSVANADGKSGYFLSADNEEQTLWLFFYSTQQELNQILKKIKH